VPCPHSLIPALTLVPCPHSLIPALAVFSLSPQWCPVLPVLSLPSLFRFLTVPSLTGQWCPCPHNAFPLLMLSVSAFLSAQWCTFSHNGFRLPTLTVLSRSLQRCQCPCSGFHIHSDVIVFMAMSLFLTVVSGPHSIFLSPQGCICSHSSVLSPRDVPVFTGVSWPRENVPVPHSGVLTCPPRGCICPHSSVRILGGRTCTLTSPSVSSQW
jgi:hypothetical protein